MSYSLPNRREYCFPAVNFGSGSAQSIKGPRGKKGTLVDIHVACTTLFTAVTTPAYVQVGTAATPAANAQLALGTLAATDALSAIGSTVGTAYTLTTATIAADTQVEVTFVAPTGGSPAGVGTVHVVIDWDD